MVVADSRWWFHEEGIYSWVYGQCRFVDHDYWEGRDYNNVQAINSISQSCIWVTLA